MPALCQSQIQKNINRRFVHFEIGSISISKENNIEYSSKNNLNYLVQGALGIKSPNNNTFGISFSYSTKNYTITSKFRPSNMYLDHIDYSIDNINAGLFVGLPLIKKKMFIISIKEETNYSYAIKGIQKNVYFDRTNYNLIVNEFNAVKNHKKRGGVNFIVGPEVALSLNQTNKSYLLVNTNIIFYFNQNTRQEPNDSIQSLMSQKALSICLGYRQYIN